MPSARLPLLFRMAQLVRGLPKFPGREAVLDYLLAREGAYPRDAIEGTFGGGLRFEGDPRLDRNVLELPLLRFARPALAGLLDAVLERGDEFADVGANLGLYTLWGARRVGPQGRVHAFEPIEQSARTLRRNAELNGFSQVDVNVCAVGAEPTTVSLYLMEQHSGRASRYVCVGSSAVQVPVVTLDAYFETRPPPRLVKIDVEGMEHEVLRGAQGLLSGPAAPLLVFEANAEFFHQAGTSYAETLRFLAERRYTVWALTTDGLRREPREAEVPGSLNVLAAREGHEPHGAPLERLRGVRFPADQNA